MKKTIIAALASLAFASTAFAATPAMDLANGQAQLGYSYTSLKTNINSSGDLGTFHGNGYQAAYGLSDKLAITGDYLTSNAKDFNVYNNGVLTGSITGFHFNSTEIGLQYKLNDNIAISAGSVNSKIDSSYGSTPSTETFGSIAYKQNISKNVEGYASYLKSSNVQDMKAGLTYNLGSKTSLDVGYRDYQNNGTSNLTAKGIGFGLNHKF